MIHTGDIAGLFADSSAWPEAINVDLFAGGGGASTGMAEAGVDVHLAINHSREALAMHQANHPDTRHLCNDVFEVDPEEACAGRRVGTLWASPDCTHFSKAKGGKPIREKGKKSRSLAWVVVKWAAAVRPDVIMLENVEEFRGWGPVVKGRPCPKRKGQHFKLWVHRLEQLGYVVDHRELRARDYGSPTIRKRLFVIARCDGRPIVWPAASHTKETYRAAAECIDFSQPCHSVFMTPEQAKAQGVRVNRPLETATMGRVANGFMRHVVDTDDPYIVEIANYGRDSHGSSVNEPLRTITAHPKGGSYALAVPYTVSTNHGDSGGRRSYAVTEPMRTVCASSRGGEALVTAYMTRHFGGMNSRDLREPCPTTTTRGTQNQLTAALLVKLRGTCRNGQSVREPAPTLTASGQHVALAYAYLIEYYGSGSGLTGRPVNVPAATVTSKDRFAITVVETATPLLSDDDRYRAWKCARFFEKYRPEEFQPDPRLPAPSFIVTHGSILVDLYLRMLTPRELFRCQGFSDEYIIDLPNPVTGKPLSKTAQVRLVGNSVCPQLAEALARANCIDQPAEVAA